MISDTLFEASNEIKRYLTDEAFARVYPPGPLRDRIEACLAEMNTIRTILDTPPPAKDDMDACPKCASTNLHRDSVDVGVGIIYGPWGCPDCGWSEDEAYDLSDGRSALDETGGAIDQYGGYHPPGSSMALAYRLAEVAGRLGKDDMDLIG